MFKKNPNVLNHTFYFWMHIWRKQKTHNSIHHSLYETADLFKTIFTVKGHWFTSWPGQMDTICKVCAFSFCVNMVFFGSFFFVLWFLCKLGAVVLCLWWTVDLGLGSTPPQSTEKPGPIPVDIWREAEHMLDYRYTDCKSFGWFWIQIFFLLETCRFWFWQLFFSVKFQT